MLRKLTAAFMAAVMYIVPSFAWADLDTVYKKFQSECFTTSGTSAIVFTTSAPPVGATKLIVNTGALIVRKETADGNTVWIYLSTATGAPAAAIAGDCTNQWPLTDEHPEITLNVFGPTTMSAINTGGAAVIRWAVVAQ